ncbi:restriction endonuclease [Micromonospora sp. NPDC047187]|uniref:nSTAND3 domain-containing NTPase n=1 Tax=Micromonospora sp. NPDC047187 TaxID=3155262 RepID=UPI0033E8F293
MDGFDLGRLTDHDFEEVCRDLFGEILGLRLEIFPRGPDGGVDLRHTATDGTTTVVQCKHWWKSGRSRLESHLRKQEVPKVRKVRPGRYLIAASVELTDTSKQRIRRDFDPYIKTTGDIFGLDDIVAALRERPAIVERHFRLWLSGTVVLQTVLRQEDHLRASWLCEELPHVAATFVPHAGFERARRVLEEQRVCILTGIPGAGKTTTAMMLAAWLMGRGHQLYEVSENASEVLNLWRDDEAQVFVYDDFLGGTTLDRLLSKNEDRRLLSLIHRIRRTPGKALVMTSRDYILEEARRKYDKLSKEALSLVTSTVRLDDLDLLVRGQILYNHVYRSGVSRAQKARFAEPAVWRPIVEHPNFNPRPIEETLRLAGSDDQDIAATLLANLADPWRIWDRIVVNDLQEEAVHALEVLFTFESASLEGLSESWSWYRTEMGKPNDGRLLRGALQVLDGTMVRIHAGEIAFHNPSIADYLRRHLNAGRADIPALIAAVVDVKQAYRIMEAAGMADGAQLLTQLRAHPRQVARMFAEVEDTVEDCLTPEDDSFAAHLERLVGIAEDLNSWALASYIIKQTDEHITHSQHIPHLVELAERLGQSELIPASHSEQFQRNVANQIRYGLGDLIENRHLVEALKSLAMLERVSDEAGEPEAARLVELALERLSEFIEVDEERLQHWDVAAMDDVLDFLIQHGKVILDDDEVVVVQSMIDRFEARQKRPTPHQPGPLPRNDIERDRASVSRLMSSLADADEPADAS